MTLYQACRACNYRRVWEWKSQSLSTLGFESIALLLYHRLLSKYMTYSQNIFAMSFSIVQGFGVYVRDIITFLKMLMQLRLDVEIEEFF